ncbi:MAG: DNA-3-methyladenine glycosylase 2 family protein [Acidimicrobiales bacterium]
MAEPIRFDEARCYEALSSRDARFDGQFIAAITSTGIYCRASCPAPVRPKRENVRLFPTAAAAQAAGFRSCKRCRPDASPGSPEWDRRADLVGRAMRMIEAGDVDRMGVRGLADALHVSERHLHRTLVAAVGAGPIALARSHRANLARILLETTTTPVTDVAFAAGFSSVRQFNDTIRAVYDRTPSELRKARSHAGPRPAESDVELTVRLAVRQPYDHGSMFRWFESHRVPGVTSGDREHLARSLRLPGGPARVSIREEASELWASFSLSTFADLAPAIAIVRRMFDLDADPVRINEHLLSEPTIAPLRANGPGVRVPGSADGVETAIGAIVSQQVSVAAARTLLGRIVERFGTPIDHGEVTALFPDAAVIADGDLEGIGLTGARSRTVRSLAEGVASGVVDLDGLSDHADVRRSLLALPGVGPWTADVIALRVLRDPDILLDTDLIIRRQLESLGASPDARDRWRPWSSYVTMTLWQTYASANVPPATGKAPR